MNVKTHNNFRIPTLGHSNSGSSNQEDDEVHIPGGPVSSDASVARAFIILKAATAKWINDVQVRGMYVHIFGKSIDICVYVEGREGDRRVVEVLACTCEHDWEEV